MYIIILHRFPCLAIDSLDTYLFVCLSICRLYKYRFKSWKCNLKKWGINVKLNRGKYRWIWIMNIFGELTGKEIEGWMDKIMDGWIDEWMNIWINVYKVQIE